MTAPTQHRAGEPSAAAKARAYSWMDQVRQLVQTDVGFLATRANAERSPAERGIYVGAGTPIEPSRRAQARTPSAAPSQSSAPARRSTPRSPGVSAQTERAELEQLRREHTARTERAELEQLRREHTARTERAELEQLRREQLAGLSDNQRAQALKLTDPAHRSRFVALCRARKTQSRGAK